MSSAINTAYTSGSDQSVMGTVSPTLVDAETRFLEAKQRLLSLIRSSMDKVTNSTALAVESETTNNPLTDRLNVSASYTDGSQPTHRSPLGGSRDRHDPRAWSSASAVMGVDERELALALPLLQPVKPRSRGGPDAFHSGPGRRGRPSTGGVLRNLNKGAAAGKTSADADKPNPLAGPVGPGRSRPAAVAKRKEVAQAPRDFDLRFGPAFSADLEKMRKIEAEKLRKARFEAQSSLQLLAHIKQKSSHRGVTASTTADGVQKPFTASQFGRGYPVPPSTSPSRPQASPSGLNGSLWLPPQPLLTSGSTFEEIWQVQQTPGTAPADARWAAPSAVPAHVMPLATVSGSGPALRAGPSGPVPRGGRSVSGFQSYSQRPLTSVPAAASSELPKASILPPLAHSSSALQPSSLSNSTVSLSAAASPASPPRNRSVSAAHSRPAASHLSPSSASQQRSPLKSPPVTSATQAAASHAPLSPAPAPASAPELPPAPPSLPEPVEDLAPTHSFPVAEPLPPMIEPQETSVPEEVLQTAPAELPAEEVPSVQPAPAPETAAAAESTATEASSDAEVGSGPVVSPAQEPDTLQTDIQTPSE
jgi:hypothetical protein